MKINHLLLIAVLVSAPFLPGCGQEGGVQKELTGLWCRAPLGPAEHDVLLVEWIRFTKERSTGFTDSKPWHVYEYKMLYKDPRKGEYRVAYHYKSAKDYQKPAEMRQSKSYIYTNFAMLFSQDRMEPEPGERYREFEYEYLFTDDDSIIIQKNSKENKFIRSKDGKTCPKYTR